LASITALASYGIATHRLAFSVPLLLCTAATLGAIAAYHPSLGAVVGILVAGNAVTALAAALSLALQYWSARRSAT
ncbi:MAG TPA: hypothetical protein VMH02_01165, partial [Verrucomicrobiae bacterium]|nr:hypothetical protein [Verrucomicrobiae bacterium]